MSYNYDHLFLTSNYGKHHDSVFNIVFTKCLKYVSIEDAKALASQAMLESGWGKSLLTKEDNNWFGIKGKGKLYKTLEHQSIEHCQFRKYNTIEECIIDRLSISPIKPKPNYATDPFYNDKINLISSNYTINISHTYEAYNAYIDR